MAHELAFASIRQGDLPAEDAWRLLAPMVESADTKLAARICDVLRAWAWKALDRRRRDSELRDWVDVLNRVEAFFADRFDAIAAKIELLAELIHESLAVAEIADPDALLRRKHVAKILRTLCSAEGAWIERAELMGELGLKPANTTRLMTLLVDVGWAEQAITGREAAYRISTEGTARARCAPCEETQPLCADAPQASVAETDPWAGLELTLLTPLVLPKHERRDRMVLLDPEELLNHKPEFDWKRVGREIVMTTGLRDLHEDGDEHLFHMPRAIMPMLEAA